LKHSFTEENYLKAIHKLSESSETVSTSDIANELDIRSATVTDMLKKLAAKKLIRYQRYKGVSLTEKGVRISVRIIRKHRLWELFLFERMKFKWDEVHEIAEQLEHIQSDKLIDRLDEMLGYPKFDPHGDPIPDREGKVHVMRSVPLSDVNPGSSHRVIGLSDDQDDFLRYLDRLHVNIGVMITVNSREEYDGSRNVTINDEVDVFISEEVARKILVSIP
jgi:DtxR family Mn-dependent transcriptional regulator